MEGGAQRGWLGSLFGVALQVKGYAHIYHGWSYQDSVQERGIFPSLPGLFLMKPMRVIKGKMYALF